MAYRIRSALPVLVMLAALITTAQAEDHADEGASGFFTPPTPWQIRQAVESLLADISTRREDEASLLARTRRLLDQHADHIVYSDGNYRNVSDAIRRRLRDTGLEDDFVTTFAPEAERLLEAILASQPIDHQALSQLARSLPGTPAARDAWRLLADIAWDRGRLGNFLRYAERAGDHEDGLRKARIDAAYELLETRAPAQLPHSLDQTYPLWILADLLPPNNLLMMRRHHMMHHRQRREQTRLSDMGHRFADAGGNAIAANDGNHLVLINPHNGRVITRHRLNATSHSAPHAPVHAEGVYIAASPPNMIAIDEQGSVLWRHDIGTQISSRPVIAGDIAAVALLDGDSLSLLGLDTRSGEVRWHTLLGSLPQQPFRGHGPVVTTDLAVHRDRFVILSNSRFVAFVERDGHISGIHSYDGDDPRDRAMTIRRVQDQRRGHMRGDGNHLVIAPSDRRDLIIFPGHTHTPLMYDGQGSGDHVVDVADGHALLVGRRITCLDLDSGTALWSIAGSQGSEHNNGVIGKDLVLIHHDGTIRLHRRRDGALVSQRAVDRHEHIAVINGMLVTSRIVLSEEHPASQTIVGHGLPRSREELERSIATDPDDFTAHLALASLLRARHQDQAALEHLIKALERGAPAFHADEALRLATNKIRIAIGREQDFRTAHTRLTDILQLTDAFTSPLPFWWLGRHHETSGEIDAAQAAYTAMLNSQQELIDGGDGLRVDSTLLARLSLQRVNGMQSDMLHPPQQAPAILGDGPGWLVKTAYLAPPVVTKDRIIGYESGFITARDLSSGDIIWQAVEGLRHRAMLGLQDRSQHPGGDPRMPTVVDVIPGSAAAAAGFHDGDHLRVFNDQPITTFGDLVQAVAAVGVGQPFTAVVDRAEPEGLEKVALHGRLGTWLASAVAVQDDVVLVQGMTLDRQRQLRPDMIDHPLLTALDLATGAPRWEFDLTTKRMIDAPEQGLVAHQAQDSEPVYLSAGNHLLVGDERHMSAIVHDKDTTRTAWSIALDSSPRRWITDLVKDHIGMVEQETQQLLLMRVQDAHPVISIPADINGTVLMDGNRCFTTLSDGRLMAWDIDLAAQRWTSEVRLVDILAVRGDSLWTRQRNGSLALLDSHTGRIRQRFDDFIAVHQVIIAHDQLVVHGIDRNLQAILTGMGLRGGARRWTTALPDRLEIRGPLMPTDQGFAVILDALDERPSMWLLNRDGQTHGGLLLNPNESVITSTQAVITRSSAGLRRIGTPARHRPSTISCPQLDYEQETLTDTLLTAASKADWIRSGASAVTFFHHNRDLLVLVRMDVDAPPLRLHIDSSSEDHDARSQQLLFRYGHAPTISEQAQGWQRHMGRMIPQEEGRRLFVLGLRLSTLRQGTRRPLVHIPSDKPDAPPWWMRDAWYRLDWRPPPSAHLPDRESDQ